MVSGTEHTFENVEDNLGHSTYLLAMITLHLPID
jgi:hypothetical protein